MRRVKVADKIDTCITLLEWLITQITKCLQRLCLIVLKFKAICTKAFKQHARVYVLTKLSFFTRTRKVINRSVVSTTASARELAQ